MATNAEGSAGLSPEGRFYQRLLNLDFEGEPEELLLSALQSLVELTGAVEGYIEARDDAGSSAVQWTASLGCDEDRVSEIQKTISHGIIAQTIATGRAVVTGSAISDPRFRHRKSVKDNVIEAVVCAPLGRGEVLGAVYLQGAAEALRVSTTETQRFVAYFGRAMTPFLAANLARLRGPIDRGANTSFAAARYRSRAMHDIVQRLSQAAPLDVHVLLTGPTGTGKTLLARCVHAASHRAAGPFVELNCAAIPETLLENELFGATEGAHSAVPRGGVVGKVESAEGGTLFLDEIGELSVPSQAKVLQLLQSRTYHRLGSSELRRADIRIVAATNRDLRHEVSERRFREDLYYRLNVFEVRVPPISERAEDISPLAQHFVRQAGQRHDLPVRRLSAGALRAVIHAEWHGNVREIGNRIETGVLNAHMRGSHIVEARDLFPEVESDAGRNITLQEATRQFQKRHVLSTLEACDWNVSEAARQLDVARSHAYNLMKVHGLRRQ